MSLTDIDASFGKFDYIICHGVQLGSAGGADAIPRICRENLSAEGVAYISYNTYPGWKTSDVVRDAMQLNSLPPRRRLKSCNAPRKCGLLQQGLWDGNPMKWALANAARSLPNSLTTIFPRYLKQSIRPCYFWNSSPRSSRPDWFIWPTRNCTARPSTYGPNVAQHLAQLPQTTRRCASST